MKKLSVLIVLMTVLCISLVSALNTSSQVTIGSNAQEASNYNDDRYGIYQEATLEFDTTNTITIQSITPISPFINDAANLISNNINLTLVSQSSGTVTLSGRIPEGLDAVNSQGFASSFKVADVVFINTFDSSTKTVELYMQRENNLEFDKVNLKYGEEEEKITDGEDIDELKPGDSGDFEFTIKNLFSSSSDVSIDDIEIQVKESGTELDIDEDDEIGSISANEKETETIPFSIDSDADQGKYDVFLRILGEDDYGARHGQQFSIVFDITKDRDDISIIRLDLNPDSINLCDNRQSTLTVGIKNIGRNDQREGEVIVENVALGYYNTVGTIELDEGDSVAKRFPIIIPESTKPGVYIFNVIVKNDKEEISDERTISLVVSSCPTSDSSTSTGISDATGGVQIIGPQGTGVTSAQSIPGIVKPSTSTSNNDSVDFSTLALGILALVLLLAVLFMVYMVFKN